jgi:hypothetical protein
LDQGKATTAFVGTRYVGTSELGRPLTPPEKKELASFLRNHDFTGACMVSLRFANKLTRTRSAAQDLQARAVDRFMRGGWDPSELTLAKRMCRLVWSEGTHEVREDKARRKAEEVFLREEGLAHSEVNSIEDFAVRFETEADEDSHANRRSEQLRAAFLDAKDAVNLQWLDYWLDGIDEPAEMARLSGRDVRDFYRAADRRNRHVNNILAADRGEKPKEDA